MDLPPGAPIPAGPAEASLRAVEPRDAAAMSAVERASTPQPWTLAQIEASITTEHCDGWIIEVDGQLVAHLVTTWVADEAEVLTIATLPAHRRRGLAAALLRVAFAAWRARGVATVWLEVRADNPGAQALYEGLGWVRFGARRGYYRDGCDAWLYRLDLTRAA
jgi:ribosomal-protein-alanine N-acetyltransferase